MSKSHIESLRDFITSTKTFLEDYESDEFGSMNYDSDVTEEIPASVQDDKLIKELDTIMTPVLVTQEIDNDVKDRIMEACSEANVLAESTILKFDTDARRSQLVKVCSLLLARNDKSPDYAAHIEASKAAKATSIKIQNDYNAAARELADRYLQHVSISSDSDVARRAADNLK